MPHHACAVPFASGLPFRLGLSLRSRTVVALMVAVSPLLGRGRFGSVYVAMNIENGELLAVKQVPIESQTDKRMLQREIALTIWR